jgi:predicted PurR-regulated permease PerM
VLAVGSLIVSQIDNFLRPMFMAGRTGMHTLLLFISIMGGVSLFGLVGTVVGPLVAAVFVTVLAMFRREPETNPQ